MRIPLNRFDECIDETILKRGLTYFRNGKVHEPEESASGEYEALVEGTEPYTVRLVIDRGEVVEHLCSCPYDAGPVCKHVAAVLFYLQKDVLGLKEKKRPAKGEGAKKPTKRKTVEERVDAMLETVDPDALRQFVREQASQNVQFRNLFLSSFANPDSGESKSYYTQQLTAILRSHKDQGFIGWSASNSVARGVQNILQMARKHFEAKNIREGLLVCMAVLEQMVKALQYADDSNGSIGGCINDAYDMMLAIARSNPASSIKKLLLDYGMKAIEKKLFDGWDWHVGMMRMAAALVEDAEEAGALLALLDRESGDNYTGKSAQAIKYELLAKTSGEAAADAWLEANLGNSELRRIALQKALGNCDFEKARTIAQDGIAHDKPKYPGLVSEWYDWLLKIAVAQGERELVIHYARLLFLQSNWFQEKYYFILKQQVEPERWVSFVDELLREIESSRKPYLPQELLAGIFISEGWTERLLNLVRQVPNISVIAQYESNLAKEFSAELVELYAQAITDYLKEHVSRNHYQEACRYMRRMIKLGGREKTNELIAALRQSYPQRRALMEELERV
jgi:uncharacterized Zn finger protein